MISSAQQFMLDGEVVHDASDELESIHVFNSTTSRGTLTSRNGKFKIAVSIGDTLHITALQFKAEKIIISLEHFVSKKIRVELQQSTTELDEILLKNHTLTGFLKRDAGNIKTEPVINAVSLGIIEKDIRLLTQSERQLKTARSGFLDPLINALSGRTKMLKKRVELDKKNLELEKLLEKFPAEYLTNELNIDEDKVYDFILYCEADPKFPEKVKKDRIQVLHFLKQKSETYLKLQLGE